MKQCHYSVLEVDVKATADEIRQAYRQLSLRWHPDKNKNNVEEATERFQSIAAAYEILSDPNERAWYDSHRKKILSGISSGGDENSEYDPLDINIWKYFSRNVFLDFSDNPQGFYSVYDGLFSVILEEEMRYLSKDSSDYMFWSQANKFGDSSMDLDKVMDFYRFWSNFSSTRSFSWKDIWNLNQAQNRKIRRIMENENSKERKQGRKEYNETIRRLVKYVKKMDPRVLTFMKIKSEETAKIKIEKEKEKEIQNEKRRKAREEAKLEELKRMEELEAERSNLHAEDETCDDCFNSSEGETIVYRCKLCNKFFKSEQQLNTHVKSKKHILKAKEAERKAPLSTFESQSEDKNMTVDSSSDLVINDFEVTDMDDRCCNSCSDRGECIEECLDYSEESQETSGSVSDEDIDVEKITELMDELGGRNRKNRRNFATENDLDDVGTNNKGKPKKKNKKKSNSVKITKENENEQFETVIDRSLLWKCLVCSEKFESRNKLFAHIKESKHADIKRKSNYNNSKAKR